MNLVLSGPIDENLRNHVAALVAPRAVVRLHDRAYRFEGAMDSARVRMKIQHSCEIARVDHAYVRDSSSLSDFKLLAIDMDSTLITIECIDELADFAGKKIEVSEITKAAMRGEIDFTQSLIKRVSLLAGLSENILEVVARERLRLSPGALELIAESKRNGIYIALLSGGFTYFSSRLEASLGLSFSAANELEMVCGHLTGRIKGEVVDGAKKALFVRDIQQAFQILEKETIAIGDGANDLPMFSLSSFSVAYHAKPSVSLASTCSVQFSGLNTVLDYLRPQ